jgi:hypothetical protein
MSKTQNGILEDIEPKGQQRAQDLERTCLLHCGLSESEIRVAGAVTLQNSGVMISHLLMSL